MKFSYQLIEKYKTFKNYSQDKQVVADIDAMTKGSLSQIKRGERHLTPNQCIFICNEMGIDFYSLLKKITMQNRHRC